MENESETVREVCAECCVFDAYERFKAAKDAEIARLKAALKPVLECNTMDAAFCLDNALWAVREAQSIIGARDDKNYFDKENDND